VTLNQAGPDVCGDRVHRRAVLFGNCLPSALELGRVRGIDRRGEKGRHMGWVSILPGMEPNLHTKTGWN
jgi:hypothetical protein